MRLPDHLLFKILTTYVMEPADVCSETVWYFKNLCVKDCRDSPLVKTMPSNAGDESLIPGWGTKILHALEQLSPCAATTKSERHNWGVCEPQGKILHAAINT